MVLVVGIQAGHDARLLVRSDPPLRDGSAPTLSLDRQAPKPVCMSRLGGIQVGNSHWRDWPNLLDSLPSLEGQTVFDLEGG